MFYAFKKNRNPFNSRVFNLSKPQSVEDEEKNYVYIQGDDIWAVLDEVLDTLNPYIYTQFAKMLCRKEDEDSVKIVRELEQAVADFGDAEACLDYAQSIKGANIQYLQKALIQTKNPEKCYEFAKNVPGADVDALSEAVYLYGRPSLWLEFAKNIPGANITVFEHATGRYGSAYDCYKFLENVPGADFDYMQGVILDKKDELVCIDLVRNFKDKVDIEAVQDVVAQSDNDSAKVVFSEITALPSYEKLFKDSKSSKKKSAGQSRRVLEVEIDPELE